MTAAQRKELYDTLDYDEETAVTQSLNEPRDALKARVAARLKRGSFALQSEVAGKSTEIISIVFDLLQANVLQRPDNLALSMSLGGFGVFDKTTQNTIYPQIAHVKDADDAASFSSGAPFFTLDFESKPLDDRADMALSVRLLPMEIVYHRGYVEAAYQFFKPPESQLESVEALLNVASQTLEGIRRDTRAGLEFALQTHKTVDLQMDLSAPIIIIPEDITSTQGRHLVIDAGHISMESELADKDAVLQVQSRRKKEYTEADWKSLEDLMYDKFTLKLESAQVSISHSYISCSCADLIISFFWAMTSSRAARRSLRRRVMHCIFSSGRTSRFRCKPRSCRRPTALLVSRWQEIFLNFSLTSRMPSTRHSCGSLMSLSLALTTHLRPQRQCNQLHPGHP
jgi:vacuolar protein sorting-associated protein 13A/C